MHRSSEWRKDAVLPCFVSAQRCCLVTSTMHSLSLAALNTRFKLHPKLKHC